MGQGRKIMVSSFSYSEYTFCSLETFSIRIMGVVFHGVPVKYLTWGWYTSVTRHGYVITCCLFLFAISPSELSQVVTVWRGSDTFSSGSNHSITQMLSLFPPFGSFLHLCISKGTAVIYVSPGIEVTCLWQVVAWNVVKYFSVLWIYLVLTFIVVFTSLHFLSLFYFTNGRFVCGKCNENNLMDTLVTRQITARLSHNPSASHVPLLVPFVRYLVPHLNHEPTVFREVPNKNVLRHPIACSRPSIVLLFISRSHSRTGSESGCSGSLPQCLNPRLGCHHNSGCIKESQTFAVTFWVMVMPSCRTHDSIIFLVLL